MSSMVGDGNGTLDTSPSSGGGDIVEERSSGTGVGMDCGDGMSADGGGEDGSVGCVGDAGIGWLIGSTLSVGCDKGIGTGVGRGSPGGADASGTGKGMGVGWTMPPGPGTGSGLWNPSGLGSGNGLGAGCCVGW